jgi:hypothetical protein
MSWDARNNLRTAQAHRSTLLGKPATADPDLTGWQGVHHRLEIASDPRTQLAPQPIEVRAAMLLTGGRKAKHLRGLHRAEIG